jgi:hypothetical protein
VACRALLFLGGDSQLLAVFPLEEERNANKGKASDDDEEGLTVLPGRERERHNRVAPRRISNYDIDFVEKQSKTEVGVDNLRRRLSDAKGGGLPVFHPRFSFLSRCSLICRF